jgi:hypothetical protein
MNRIALSIAIAVLLMTGGFTEATQSRLERDYEQQYSEMRVLLGETDEPSCGGTWLKVWLLGKEVRKMDWACETSQRFIDREFYFSRGKPQLVIETTYRKLDNSGNRLREPRLECSRRYWLDDRSAGPAGVQVRRKLREHADSLVNYFSAHRAELR